MTRTRAGLETGDVPTSSAAGRLPDGPISKQLRLVRIYRVA
jgi:hypothetical protein